MGLIRWIFGFLTALAVMAFAVMNREPVPLSWSPLHPPLDVPVFAFGLGLMALGFFLGSFITWLNTNSLRREKRRQKKQIKLLEKELEAVNENKSGEAPSDFFPALPKK